MCRCSLTNTCVQSDLFSYTICQNALIGHGRTALDNPVNDRCRVPVAETESRLLPNQPAAQVQTSS